MVYDGDMRAAHELLLKLEKKQVPSKFTARDIYHGKHWAYLQDAFKVKCAIRFLLDRGHIEMNKIKTGGRPKIYYLYTGN
jgi:hypothetical protein